MYVSSPKPKTDADPKVPAASRARAPSVQAPPRPRVRFAPPLSAPMLSQVATMSGFLKKQADNEPGKWTKYFFVLKPTTYLYYYMSKDDVDPRGIIDLEFLRDVRFNTECVERSVGASANGFRLTGQVPAQLIGGGDENARLRPVFLDAESRQDAELWMDALRHHRFDLSRHAEYDCLVECMEEADKRLTRLTADATANAVFARSVVRKGLAYLSRLRGDGVDGDDPLTHEEASHGQDLKATLRALSALLDDLFIQADSQRRIGELLRQREAEFLETGTQLKRCEAELKMQMSRVDQLEREIEALLGMRQTLRCEFETRYTEMYAREQELRNRERELLLHVEERERVSELRSLEADRKIAEWVEMLETTTAYRGSMPDLQLPTPQSIFDRVKTPEDRSPRETSLSIATDGSSSPRSVHGDVEDASKCLNPDNADDRSSPDGGCSDKLPAAVEMLLGGANLPHDANRSAKSETDSPSERTRLEVSLSVESVGATTSSPLHESLAPLHCLLPLGWTCKESKSYSGKQYYFNVVTGETRWDPPLEEELPWRLSTETVVEEADSRRFVGDGRGGFVQLRRSLDLPIGRGSARSSGLVDFEASTRHSHSEDPSAKRARGAWTAKLMRKVPFPRASRVRVSVATPPSTPSSRSLAPTATSVQRHAF